jgi:ADP-ribose pyrophosphatase
MSRLAPWQLLSRRTVVDRGRFLAVESHTVRLPDGTVIQDWPWVITPDYVNVVAVTSGGEFLLFRQRKYAVDGVTLAPVGGYMEPGEDPLSAARRELREETGFESDEWTPLGSYAVDANRGVGRAHLFLASGARRTGDRAADDLEEQELLLMSRRDVEAALTTGEFKVLPWVAAVALALRYLS